MSDDRIPCNVSFKTQDNGISSLKFAGEPSVISSIFRSRAFDTRRYGIRFNKEERALTLISEDPGVLNAVIDSLLDANLYHFFGLEGVKENLVPLVDKKAVKNHAEDILGIGRKKRGPGKGPQVLF